MASRRILVLNAGSSSLKASLIEAPERTLGRVEASWGADASRASDREARLREALRSLGIDFGPGRASGIHAVGYRVVHGGDRFTTPARIDDRVVEAIRAVSGLAPLHNDVALETIEAGRRILADAPHVACFDTAFHATLDPAAYRYPVPERWYRDWGVRRFGFHGLSVAWSVRRAGELLGRPVEDLALVVAHLGSGSSVTAVAGGRTVDTSMGLTPLEGLMMGTRAGSIDPGLPFHLMRLGLASADELADALDHGSGLLGVSGSSSDMRELEVAADEGDTRAALAIEMYVRRAAAWVAFVATALPRLDALVFTAGIGENAAAVRARIVARLGVLGIAPLPDVAAATQGDDRLDDRSSSMAVLCIHAREDLVIADQCVRLLAARGRPDASTALVRHLDYEGERGTGQE